MVIQTLKIVFFMGARRKKVGQEWTCLSMKMKRISWSVIKIKNKFNCTKCNVPIKKIK